MHLSSHSSLLSTRPPSLAGPNQPSYCRCIFRSRPCISCKQKSHLPPPLPLQLILSAHATSQALSILADDPNRAAPQAQYCTQFLSLIDSTIRFLPPLPSPSVRNSPARGGVTSPSEHALPISLPWSPHYDCSTPSSTPSMPPQPHLKLTSTCTILLLESIRRASADFRARSLRQHRTHSPPSRARTQALPALPALPALQALQALQARLSPSSRLVACGARSISDTSAPR